MLDCSHGQISISCTVPSGTPCPVSRVRSFFFPRANLLHSLIMWLIVSSLSQRNLHVLFRYVLSTLALIWLVHTASFYAAIWRNYVCLFGFPLISYDHVFSYEMSLVIRLKRPLRFFFLSFFNFLVISLLLILV